MKRLKAYRQLILTKKKDAKLDVYPENTLADFASRLRKRLLGVRRRENVRIEFNAVFMYHSQKKHETASSSIN